MVGHSGIAVVGGGPNVICPSTVDDQEGIRESLKLILEDEYDLILTDNGSQCLECVRKNKDVGVVLLDIKMPKTNGMNVLEHIREEKPDLKVVMITGYKSVETATEASRLGAVGYITKPFKSEEVVKTVDAVLKKK